MEMYRGERNDTGVMVNKTRRMRSVRWEGSVAMSTNATLYCHDDVTLRLCVTQGGGGRGGSGLGGTCRAGMRYVIDIKTGSYRSRAVLAAERNRD